MNQLFTNEINQYLILKLPLHAYKRSNRTLPDGYMLLNSSTDLSSYRDQERALLRRYFIAWRRPYAGKLQGFRPDSPIFVTCAGRLIAGVYLCGENELRLAHWGQLHYAFIDPDHGGKGIYSVLFREAVDRAGRWGLQGLVLNSDRYMLPETYLRWGALPYASVQKTRLKVIAGRLWAAIQRTSTSLRPYRR